MNTSASSAGSSSVRDAVAGSAIDAYAPPVPEASASRANSASAVATPAQREAKSAVPAS